MLKHLAFAACLAASSIVQAQTTPPAACGLPPGTVIFGLTADHRLMEYTASSQFPKIVDVSVVARAAPNSLFNEDASLVGIDFRPADPDGTALYAVTDRGDVKKLNAFPGALRSGSLMDPVSTLGVPFLGGLHSVVDFNPVLDAIRLVGSNDQNFAVVNANGGTLNAFAQQGTLRYATGDPAQGADPYITGGAYDNNVTGAARTTFYMLDYARDTLVTIADRNGPGSSNTAGGVLKTIGPLVEASGAAVNVSAAGDIDIVTTADGRNVAVGYATRRLFCIDLSTVNPDLPVGTTQNVTIVPLVPTALPPVGGGNGFAMINEGLIDVATPTRGPVSASVSIRVTRFSPDSTIRLGDAVGFEIKIRNDGPSIASGLTMNVTSKQSNVGLLDVTSILPGGGECFPFAASNTQSQCTLPSLVSGKEITMLLTVQTVRPGSRPSSAITLTTDAFVKGLVPDPNASDNRSVLVTTVPF